MQPVDFTKPQARLLIFSGPETHLSEVIGKPGEDANLIAYAYAFERATKLRVDLLGKEPIAVN